MSATLEGLRNPLGRNLAQLLGQDGSGKRSIDGGRGNTNLWRTITRLSAGVSVAPPVVGIDIDRVPVPVTGGDIPSLLLSVFCVLQVLSQLDRYPVIVGSGRSEPLRKLTRLAESLHCILGRECHGRRYV